MSRSSEGPSSQNGLRPYRTITFSSRNGVYGDLRFGFSAGQVIAAGDRWNLMLCCS